MFVSTTASAQTQFSGWFATFGTFKVNDRLSIHFDPQVRSSNDLEHVQSFIIRPGLNVTLNKRMIVTAGYAYIGNRRVISGVDGYAPEHRIWQQFIYNAPISFFTLTNRFRLEQRFISKSFVENNELKNEGNLYANRIRYFARAVIPFSGEPGFTKGWFGGLQNELFVNFGDNDAVNGKAFDQNRAFLSLGYRLSKKIDLETGYMNQYVQGRGSAFTNNHIVQAGVYLRL